VGIKEKPQIPTNRDGREGSPSAGNGLTQCEQTVLEEERGLVRDDLRPGKTLKPYTSSQQQWPKHQSRYCGSSDPASHVCSFPARWAQSRWAALSSAGEVYHRLASPGTQGDTIDVGPKSHGAARILLSANLMGSSLHGSYTDASVQ